MQSKLLNSKRIVSEEQEKIKSAKKELLILWKMEINAAVTKKKEKLGLLSIESSRESEQNRGLKGNTFKKLKKVSRW